jgi:hypothetical protein
MHEESRLVAKATRKIIETPNCKVAARGLERIVITNMAAMAYNNRPMNP